MKASLDFTKTQLCLRLSCVFWTHVKQNLAASSSSADFETLGLEICECDT